MKYWLRKKCTLKILSAGDNSTVNNLEEKDGVLFAEISISFSGPIKTNEVVKKFKASKTCCYLSPLSLK